MSEEFDIIGSYKEIKPAEAEMNNNGQSVQVETTSTSLDNKKTALCENKTGKLIERKDATHASALTSNEMKQIDSHLMKQVEDGNSDDETAEPRCANSEWIVLKRILRMRSRTKATLSQIFFSLFRTNANVKHAIAFLNNKDTKHVWRKKEDEVLFRKDEKGVKRIIAKRGLQAVQERLKFLELDECTFS